MDLLDPAPVNKADDLHTVQALVPGVGAAERGPRQPHAEKCRHTHLTRAIEHRAATAHPAAWLLVP